MAKLTWKAPHPETLQAGHGHTRSGEGAASSVRALRGEPGELTTGNACRERSALVSSGLATGNMPPSVRWRRVPHIWSATPWWSGGSRCYRSAARGPAPRRWSEN